MITITETSTLFETLKELQPEIYHGNQKRGFWEKGKDKNYGERTMLIITELAESVDAHRGNKLYSTRFIPGVFTEYFNKENWDHTAITNFQIHVKDTVEDEIADTVIRILDTTYGFDLQTFHREYRKESTKNYANDVLRLTHYCLCAFHNEPGKDWGYVLAAIIKFCEWYNIDLVQHVQWKLKYNSSRPYKHNKAY